MKRKPASIQCPLCEFKTTAWVYRDRAIAMRYHLETHIDQLGGGPFDKLYCYCGLDYCSSGYWRHQVRAYFDHVEDNMTDFITGLNAHLLGVHLQESETK